LLASFDSLRSLRALASLVQGLSAPTRDISEVFLDEGLQRGGIDAPRAREPLEHARAPQAGARGAFIPV
jgi:hypothetical protein